MVIAIPHAKPRGLRHHRVWSAGVNRHRTWARRVLLASAITLGILLVGGAGCRKSEQGASPSTPIATASSSKGCERAPVNGLVVGANVIDLADDQDADPSNDGLRGYGSDAGRKTLDALKERSLTSVVLPVVVHVRDQTASTVAPGILLGRERTRLLRMIDDAKERGLSVVVVPHLRLESKQWRGHLAPTDVGAFFVSYTQTLIGIADLAESRCVDALSIGIEFKALTAAAENTPRFSALITALRARFSGRLLYSANWDEAEQVAFWPLLDRIGINAFYPLASKPTADDALLLANARAVVKRWEALRKKTGRSIWLTELGIKSTTASYVEPWLWPTEVNAGALPVNEEDQRRGYQAWAQAIGETSAVEAVYFWMVPSDVDDTEHTWAFEPRQGFSFLGKKAESVVRALATRSKAKRE